MSRLFTQSFAGGEMSPEMYGRTDDIKFRSGTALLRNFIAKPQGTVVNRPGLGLVRAAKNASKRCRLIPFTFSIDQTFVIEMGEFYFRFHTGGATLLRTAVPRAYIASQAVTPNAGTDEFTTGVAHLLQVGDPVQLSYLFGGSLPAEIAYYQTYYAIIVSGTVFKLATTPQNAANGVAINITTAGSGTIRFHYVYESGDIFDASGTPIYCQLRNPYDNTFGGVGSPVSAVFSVGTTVTEGAAHGMQSGTPLVFEGAGLPPEIVPGRTYYALVFSATEYALSHTQGGTGITFSVPSTGTTNRRRASCFYTMPAGSIFEVPHPFPEAALPNVRFTQSGDVMTFTHPDYQPYELRRIAAERWAVRSVTFQAQLPSPSGVVATANRGAGTLITGYSSSGPSLVLQSSGDGHASVAEAIYVVTEYTAAPDVVLAQGFYRVSERIGTPVGSSIVVQSLSDGVAVAAAGYATTVLSRQLYYRVPANSEITYRYCVTAVDNSNVESYRPAIVSADNILENEGARTTITWGAVAGAFRYRVYREQNGLFGLIGETDRGTLTFEDSIDIAPDMGFNPRQLDEDFVYTDNPVAVAYAEQRRIFGGSRLKPLNMWMTRSGTESDLTYTIPVRDSDRIAFRVIAEDASQIQHVVPMRHLIVLTKSGEHRVTPVNTDALTPSSITVRAQTYVGASSVRPVVVNGTVVFEAARGGHLRGIDMGSDSGDSQSPDYSLRAAHLFDNAHIVDMTFAKAPLPILWATSSDGRLLAMTFIPEENISAWHQHVTDGSVESVVAVSEGAEDRVYISVLRGSARYIERLEAITTAALGQTCFLDSALIYDGRNANPANTMKVMSGVSWTPNESVLVEANAAQFTPGPVTNGLTMRLTAATGETVLVTITSVVSATQAWGTPTTTVPLALRNVTTTNWAKRVRVVTGLTHLANRGVKALADQVIVSGLTVSGSGTVTLATAAEYVHVGLPYTSTLTTIPAVLQVEADGQSFVKNVNKVWVRYVNTAGLKAGPSDSELVSILPTGALATGETDVLIPKGWTPYGQVTLVQDEPLPTTIVAMTYDLAIGG